MLFWRSKDANRWDFHVSREKDLCLVYLSYVMRQWNRTAAKFLPETGGLAIILFFYVLSLGPRTQNYLNTVLKSI